MQRKKIYFYLLVIVPLTLLVAVNTHAFVKGPKQTQQNEVTRKDVIKEKYLSSLLIKNPSDSLWKINTLPDTATETQLQIAGKAGLVINNKTGSVLFELNSSEKRPIASLVKIMTALVALEHKSLEDRIVISEKAASIGENAMGISAGETYSLRELLYGMLLNSGNDAATAIAEGVAGDLETFVKWMNMRATELGLTESYFADSCGLNDTSYSTPRDLALLTHYALKYDEFKNMVSTVEKEYPYSDEHKYIYLSNQTNLLTTYPGVKGVKTGYTEEAGLCLVTYATDDGEEVVGVVLNSIDRKGDMVLMLDTAFSKLGVAISHPLLDF